MRITTKQKILLVIQEKTGLLALSFFMLIAIGEISAQSTVTVSGQLIEQETQSPLPFANVVVLTQKDSVLMAGTISNESGRFSVDGLKPGDYLLKITSVGYQAKILPIYIGSLSPYIGLDQIVISPDVGTLNEVVVTGKRDLVDAKMDKKTFDMADNISQGGGSVMQAMQNLPGVSVQDGKLLLRGNDKVMVLIDGKQTAITGFGGQSGLDNLPASSLEKIEIINNPSARYDANGNAGIINIITKKTDQKGLTGKVGLAGGLGALWVREQNLPTIRPQYVRTPKVNPSLSLNLRKKKVNLFLQADDLYTHTLNKNEFVTRTYDDGTVIHRQTKRNRNTNFVTTKVGMDWNINESNSFTMSGMFGSEKILDNGDEPFFNQDYSERLRLWQFLEDELKTTVMGMASFQHKFVEPGHLLKLGLNYTFHRENEKYFFDNIMPTFTGHDAFKLLSDQKVIDFTADYVKPLKFGRFEGGAKLRRRNIPTNMHFMPGLNSPLDTNAGGWATYKEIIPALYANYALETSKYEAEVGVRAEYVDVKYLVNPEHNTYSSNGYTYAQPFPNVRLAYKINSLHRISVFYNRRVDRPQEVDIRIFPKYDDAELIKVGNPALHPQFTTNLELGYKGGWESGYLYGAVYHKIVDGTITRIATTSGDSKLIYNVSQNAGKSFNTGVELIFSKDVGTWYSFNLNMNAYHKQINAFSVTNLYPTPSVYTSTKQEIIAGNVKWNNNFNFKSGLQAQLTAIYLTPDIVPQGRTNARFTMNLGMKKQVQDGKGELLVNATDLFNTLVIRQKVQGDGFNYTSVNYYETQVVRAGYNYKF